MASFLYEKDTFFKGPVGPYLTTPAPAKPKPAPETYRYKESVVHGSHGGHYTTQFYDGPRHGHYYGTHTAWPPNHRGAPEYPDYTLAAHPLHRRFAHGVERIVEQPIEYRYELPPREVYTYPAPAERVLEVVREKPIVRKVVLDFYRGDGSAMEAGFKHWAAVDRARAASVGA